MYDTPITKYPLLTVLPAAGAPFLFDGQPTHIIIAWLMILAGVTGLILSLTHMIRFHLNKALLNFTKSK